MRTERQTTLVWPLWLWSIQLIPSALLIAFGVPRVSLGMGSHANELRFVAVLLVGVAWFIGALLMVANRRGRKWLVSRWPEWCLSAVAIVISVGVIDIFLTLTGIVPSMEEQRARSVNYSYGSFTRYRLIPQNIQLNDGESIHINRRGFRAPMIDPVKAEGVRRIVFLGGSQVFDYHGGGWPNMVGHELRSRGYAVEVINAGVPGHNSTDSLGKLLTDVWLLDPDIIFLCNTWNDIKYYSALTPGNPYRGLPPLKTESWEGDWRLNPQGLDRLLTFSSIYRRIRVTLIQFLISEEGRNIQARQSVPGVLRSKIEDSQSPGRSNTSVNAASEGPRQFELNLHLIAALGQKIDAETIMCRQARLESGSGISGQPVEEYSFRNTGLNMDELERRFDINNQIIQSHAEMYGLEVVDMHAALGSKSRFFHDGIHFSPEGSRAVSVLVADALEANLRRMEGPQETIVDKSSTESP